MAKTIVWMNICNYSEFNKHGERKYLSIFGMPKDAEWISEYIRGKGKRGIFRLKIFEYIQMSEYSLHTGLLVFLKGWYELLIEHVGSLCLARNKLIANQTKYKHYFVMKPQERKNLSPLLF